MFESVFRVALGVKTELVDTIQILIDGVSIPSAMTTPESVHVHALLSLMGQRGVRCAAMEVSSHAIDYRRVDGVRYAMSGFTNLTQDHLDLHGGMEEYFDSKAQLFTPERTERAVITADDPWGQRMLVHGLWRPSSRSSRRIRRRLAEVRPQISQPCRSMVARARSSRMQCPPRMSRRASIEDRKSVV